MKKQLMILIFGLLFGIIIGVNIPKAEATQPNTTEIMEMQSGQSMNGKFQWETVVVNGKRLVIFSTTEGESTDLELFW